MAFKEEIKTRVFQIDLTNEKPDKVVNRWYYTLGGKFEVTHQTQSFYPKENLLVLTISVRRTME